MWSLNSKMTLGKWNKLILYIPWERSSHGFYFTNINSFVFETWTWFCKRFRPSNVPDRSWAEKRLGTNSGKRTRFIIERITVSKTRMFSKDSFKTQVNLYLRENIKLFLIKFPKFDIKYSAYYRKKKKNLSKAKKARAKWGKFV